MAYDPEEERTQQIPYTPEGMPHQPANRPESGPPPQYTGSHPDTMPEYPSSPAGPYFTPQGASPAPSERVPAEDQAPMQLESYPPPPASPYFPPVPNYPPAPPGAAEAQQPAYQHPWQSYQPEPYGAAPPQPPTPGIEQGSAPPYSPYPYAPPSPAPPARQAGGYGQPPAPSRAREEAGARPGFNARQFWHEMALLGQISGVAGLLMLIFFFLPWLYTPDFRANLSGRTTIPTVNYSGWRTASGVQLFSNVPALNLFPHLWLVLLCALALIALALLLGRHRMRVRTAALLLPLISLVALLMEFFFLIQVSSLASAIRIGLGGTNQTPYGTSWGFWLAVVTTIAALGVGVYMLLEEFAPNTFRRSRAPGVPGGPGQQPTPTA